MNDPAVPFRYRAVSASGAVEAGVLVAPDPESAREIIVGRGLYPLGFAPAHPAVARARIPLPQLAAGMSSLAAVLEGGTSTASALLILEDVLPRSWRARSAGIAAEIRDGSPLSAALARASLGLPRFAIAMIRAGEERGEVAPAVRQVAEILERTEARRMALRSATAYPALLVVVGGASVLLLLTLVVPRFAAMIDDLGAALPVSTRFLLATAWFITASAPFAISAAGCAALLVWWWRRSSAGQLRLDGLLLRAPAVGRLLHMSASGRALGILGSLLRTGLPLPGAMAYAADASGNAVVMERWVEARSRVVGGERLSESLRATAAVPESAARLVRVGEESGSMPALLAQAARLQEQQVEREIRSAVRLIEPAAVISFGAVVAFVAGAILQAVYAARPIP